MQKDTTRIALIHAVYVAMQPVEDAFRRCWPEAERVNLIDDALPADLQRDGTLTDAMRSRIQRLASHAGVSEFLCKRVGLQLTEIRSPN